MGFLAAWARHGRATRPTLNAIGRWLWSERVFLALVFCLRSRLSDRPGALFFCYVGLYSVGRFAIESLRVDSFWLGGLRVPQLASVAGLLIAVVGVLLVSRRPRPVAR